MCTKPLLRIKDLFKMNIFFENGAKIKQLKEIYTPPRYSIQMIPCGNCIECRLKHSQEWAIRCMAEKKIHENNLMLTLTYNDDNLNIVNGIDTTTGEVKKYATLSIKDHQKFMKKMRKKFGKIRFFMSGEYGDQTKRPHYHYILFGLKIEDLKFWKNSKTEWSNQKNKLYNSKTIDKIWGKGFAVINEVNYETCAYVARYVTKKWKGDAAIDKYTSKNIIPPFCQMSRNPGIGANLFFEKEDKFKNGDKIISKTSKKTLLIKAPRYYDKLLQKFDAAALQKVKQKRIQKANEILEKILNDKRNFEEQLQTKDYILNQSNHKLKRIL